MKNTCWMGIVAVALVGCGDPTSPPDAPPGVVLDTRGLPPLPETPENPLTRDGIELGRKLFHDTILSGDDTQSCASCHDQAFAFSDRGRRVSTGIDGIDGTRNAPPLINLGWNSSFFWDGRSPTLEAQAIEPVPNPIEMHLPWPEALERLRDHSEYPSLFAQAFGDETTSAASVTQERTAKAIAQFERTLISNDSRFDKSRRGEVTLTDAEERGRIIFFSEVGECFHCHGSSLFTDDEFHDNGLDLTYEDNGLGDVTGNSFDDGKFRTPTLRNIEYTAPYMHDGRFATLEEVVDHYSEGIQRSENLAPVLGVLPSPGLELTDAEKADLIAFLRALSDPEFLLDPNLGP